MSIGPWDPNSGMSTQPPIVPHPPIRGIDRLPEEVLKPPPPKPEPI